MAGIRNCVECYGKTKPKTKKGKMMGEERWGRGGRRGSEEGRGWGGEGREGREI